MVWIYPEDDGRTIIKNMRYSEEGKEDVRQTPRKKELPKECRKEIPGAWKKSIVV